MQDTDHLNLTPEGDDILESNEESMPEIEFEELMEPILEGETPPIEKIEPAEIKETKIRKFLRKFLRWSAGVLIIFGLGMILAIFSLYRPALREIESWKSDLGAANTQIEDLKATISTLEDQITDLQSLEGENATLLGEQKALELRVAILDSRLDVANAILALKEEDSAKARISLNKTSVTLDTISSLLETDQQDVIAAMKQRLTLVMDEIESDPYAAQSDLDVLATKLLELEDALFSR